MDMMTPRQTMFTLGLAALLLLFILELVRRRRLREEYSWLWVLASGLLLILVAYPPLLAAIITISGASKATTTIFMLSIAFLAVVCVHMCTKLTDANIRARQLAQKMALLGLREPEPASDDPSLNSTTSSRGA